MPWRREWLPMPVFLPGEFHGQRSLVGYGPWDGKESDTIEWLSPTQKRGWHKGLLHSSSALVVLVVGVWMVLVWLQGWCVDSETAGPSYLYFSFQSLQNHMEIEQMLFGDVERSDYNTNIFRRNMGNVKNCQFSEYLLVMFSSSKFPLVLSLIVSWTKHLHALLVSN